MLIASGSTVKLELRVVISAGTLPCRLIWNGVIGGRRQLVSLGRVLGWARITRGDATSATPDPSSSSTLDELVVSIKSYMPGNGSGRYYDVTFDLVSTSLGGPLHIALSAPGDGLSIHYADDGSTPTPQSPRYGSLLELKVSDEEIEKRLAAWQRPEPKIKTGYLALY